MGQQSSQLAEALESFLPSFAQAIEQRGLDPHQDDWPTCSDFRFLANLRDSITEQAGANQPTVVSCH